MSIINALVKFRADADHPVIAEHLSSAPPAIWRAVTPQLFAQLASEHASTRSCFKVGLAGRGPGKTVTYPRQPCFLAFSAAYWRLFNSLAAACRQAILQAVAVGCPSAVLYPAAARIQAMESAGLEAEAEVVDVLACIKVGGSA